MSALVTLPTLLPAPHLPDQLAPCHRENAQVRARHFLYHPTASDSIRAGPVVRLPSRSSSSRSVSASPLYCKPTKMLGGHTTRCSATYCGPECCHTGMLQYSFPADNHQPRGRNISLPVVHKGGWGRTARPGAVSPVCCIHARRPLGRIAATSKLVMIVPPGPAARAGWLAENEWS